MLRYICLLLAACLLPCRAFADIELVQSGALGPATTAQSKIEQLQDLQESVSKLQETTMQGFDQINDKVGEIKDVVENPLGVGATMVMEGLQGDFDGSSTENESSEKVKETYNRVFGQDNNITIAKEKQAQINKLLGDSSARLYARALILRQDLLAEENPDDKLDTIQDALKATNAMMIQSSRRWNKILEMQAYINEYNNTLAIQNFTLEQEDVADE